MQGVTTITDLHNDLAEQTIEVYHAASRRPDFPVRLVPALASVSHTPEQGIAKLEKLRPTNNDRLHYGIVKLVVDGSIQGFTARLRWPGYHNGAPNGLWYIAPEELPRIVEAYHRAGVQLHIHTNGDEATELALDAIEAAQTAMPRPDHRHTLQHCQMVDAALFKRMKALGVCANLFANHLYYWGDSHYELTMGPERAHRLDATGTAQRCGVQLRHSFRRAGNAAEPAVHRLVRGQPRLVGRTHPRPRYRGASASSRLWPRSPSAPPTR